MRGDEKGPPRGSPFNDKGLRSGPEETYLQSVSDDHWKAGQELPEMGKFAIFWEGTGGLYWSKEDAFRRAIRNLTYGGPLVYSDLSVIPGNAVNLDKVLTAIFRSSLGCSGHCSPPPCNEEDIARESPQGFQILGIYPGQAFTHVVDKGLGDTQG